MALTQSARAKKVGNTSSGWKGKQLQHDLEPFKRLLGEAVQRNAITYNAAITVCEKGWLQAVCEKGSKAAKLCRLQFCHKCLRERRAMTEFLGPSVLAGKGGYYDYLQSFHQCLRERREC